MADDKLDDERVELIAHMFALLTAKLEDAAGAAAECQGKDPQDELLTRAREIAELAQQVITIATEAIVLLSSDP